MSTLASRTIDALRHEHDDLSAVATSLTTDQLDGPSGASEWSVAQVLSHLGSGSEINLATLQAALGEREAPEDSFNQSVWDRWNAMTPTDQRAGFVQHNGALVEAWEALTPDQQDSLEVTVSFLPAPLTAASYAGMRLNEVAHHGWDVRTALDAGTALLDSSTAVLAEHLAGDLGFLLGFIGKADRVTDEVVLAVGDTGYDIVIADSVSLQSASGTATATLSGPLEAGLRLISGRLGPAYTPSDLAVTGNVTLDELRAVFPGY
ncbi:MAG: hypothetical protein JWR52_828 [Marmoricola sp.]|nr:hypothetical protein [Marmoricola sp.]